ncbi:MAG: hypothetical protein HY819_11155 [Acidobacteria bacterium]|nr:hypothetical protein [Acidobacteriota bacterium]
MIIVWGERLYGKVNQVDNQIHVATRFFHIQFIPLIPLQSFIVINGTESDGQFQGLAIAMSLKSVLAAYLRTLLVIGCIVFIFRAFMMFSGESPTTILGMLNLMVGGFLVLSFWGSYQLMKADEQEAKKLFQELRSVGIY